MIQITYDNYNHEWVPGAGVIKVVTGPRKSGRTTELIKLAVQDPNFILIVSSEADKKFAHSHELLAGIQYRIRSIGEYIPYGQELNYYIDDYDIVKMSTHLGHQYWPYQIKAIVVEQLYQGSISSAPIDDYMI